MNKKWQEQSKEREPCTGILQTEHQEHEEQKIFHSISQAREEKHDVLVTPWHVVGFNAMET